MKHILYFAPLALLFACKEPTVENSVYKNDILQLDNKFQQLDSAYTVFQKIDKESLHVLVNNGKKKFSLSREQYVTDTLIIPFDYALAVYKGTFVKPFKNVKGVEAQIKKEFNYNKKQYKNFRENLIHETFKTDTAALFLSQELTGYNELNQKIKKYNANANNALAMYDSLTNELDSIVNLYGGKK